MAVYAEARLGELLGGVPKAKGALLRGTKGGRWCTAPPPGKRSPIRWSCSTAPAYERALVQRGDVTLWLSTDVRAAWRPLPSGQPRGQKRFSDFAIRIALTLRLVFRLPLRQAEGFLRSVLSLMDVDLEAPDHTTLSRRSRHLEVGLHRVPAKRRIHLIVDSTGLSIVGEGEWAAAKHGVRGQRGWKKLHLGVDRSGVIVAHALTDPAVEDATAGIGVIEALDANIARVTADPAYDTIAVDDTATARGATFVVPPTKSARVSRRRPRSDARDRTINEVQRIGRLGRAEDHSPSAPGQLRRSPQETSTPTGTSFCPRVVGSGVASSRSTAVWGCSGRCSTGGLEGICGTHPIQSRLGHRGPHAEGSSPPLPPGTR